MQGGAGVLFFLGRFCYRRSRDTHELATTVQPGAALYGLESHLPGKVVTFGGGYPLWRDGQLIAGLGISGGLGI